MEEERQERQEEREEAGRKGGAAAMAAGMPAGVTREAVVALWTRDRVRWGPVWAGFLIALGIQLILGAIGLVVAFSSYDPASADFAENAASTLGIWSAVSLLISLFVGGYVAGRLAAIAGVRNGLVQGTVVWALALLAGTLLSALGIGGVLGAAANTMPMLRGIRLSPDEGRAAVDAARSGALYFVIGSVLAWAAAAGGGVLGAAQREEEIEGT